MQSASSRKCTAGFVGRGVDLETEQGKCLLREPWIAWGSVKSLSEGWGGFKDGVQDRIFWAVGADRGARVAWRKLGTQYEGGGSLP
jgi:hypothetical protein